MGFLSDVFKGAKNLLTGSEDAKAAKQSMEVQKQQAISNASDIGAASKSALSRYDPLQEVGQRGIDLSGFLGDADQQFSFLQNNPLFQLGLDNLNKQTSKSASSTGRLNTGDTYDQIVNNATLAGQPILDRQRQDIMNLLGISQNATNNQANIEMTTAQDVANLLSGGAASEAAGIVGAQNAKSGAFGNIIDLGTSIFGGIGTNSSPTSTVGVSPNAITNQQFTNQYTGQNLFGGG